MGITIILAIGKDQFGGQIIWKNGEHFGVEFHERLSDEIVQQIADGRDITKVEVQLARDQFGRPLPSLKQPFRGRL